MGTRSGDIDPALPFYLNEHAGIDFSDIETALNHDSGLEGLCGTRDMREIHRLAEADDARAALAIDIYCYRICKYVGAYHVALDGIDALIFTAGIGEHDACIRQSICAQLAVIGIDIDETGNKAEIRGIAEISTPRSAVRVLVIATDEELEIARQTTRLIQ
jgi:acetate kinase